MQTIIDHLTERQSKPIEILHCLQTRKRDGNYFFDSSPANFKSFLLNAIKIERIAEVELDKKFDLIKVDDCIFLGHWNNGTVKS